VGPLSSIELLDVTERLTPAHHQTHRRYALVVPSGWTALRVHVRYAPKFASTEDSQRLMQGALSTQQGTLLDRGVDAQLVHVWARSSAQPREVANLLTISMDDADGVYRGAAHRQAADMHLSIDTNTASPGLIAGPLPPGEWHLTLSVHTLVSPVVELSVHVAADTAASSPSAERTSA
jgi:hypothetical protein